MMRIKIIPKNLPLLIAIASFLFSGCQYDTEPTKCFEIVVVGKDNCRGGILISVNSRKQIGKTITYSDGKTYTNVIMVYSEVSIPDFTYGFVQIRDFDKRRDINCPPNYNAVSEVPAKIATFWSEDPC